MRFPKKSQKGDKKMIEVKNLTKKYGAKTAVENLSFSVADGEILGFLGPNGAGKSTTMNILTGYLSSEDGQVLINGTDILAEPLKAKKDIGYLPELPPLYMDMTVCDYLDFIYALKKCKLPKKAHIEEVCKLTKITDVYKRVIKNLSKGYRQRVGLAQALIGNPPIVIMDEPTVGLDPKQIIEIRTLIKKLGKRHTVILSSHILSEIQSTCDRVIIINNGKIAADGTVESLTKDVSGKNILTVIVADGKDRTEKAIRTIKNVESVRYKSEPHPHEYEFEVVAKEGADIRRELSKRLADDNIPLIGLTTNALTLEDIFLKITLGAENLSEEGTPKAKPAKEFSRESLMTAHIASSAYDVLHAPREYYEVKEENPEYLVKEASPAASENKEAKE
jgi:ABC-2 type transport system ATP-binding protein